MPNSPLANAASDEVALSDGRLAIRRDEGRAVSIEDVLRHGGVDRIEQEKIRVAAEPDGYGAPTRTPRPSCRPLWKQLRRPGIISRNEHQRK